MAMKKFTVLMWVALFGVGCASGKPESEMWVGDALRQASIDRAIVSQATLYPYHFVTDTAELNDLGRRDLRVLAKHYRKHSGDLALWRGGASDELYAERQNAVMEQLFKMGVLADRVDLGDRVPGRRGVPSERLIKILSEQELSAPTAFPIQETR